MEDIAYLEFNSFGLWEEKVSEPSLIAAFLQALQRAEREDAPPLRVVQDTLTVHFKSDANCQAYTEVFFTPINAKRDLGPAFAAALERMGRWHAQRLQRLLRNHSPLIRVETEDAALMEPRDIQKFCEALSAVSVNCFAYTRTAPPYRAALSLRFADGTREALHLPFPQAAFVSDATALLPPAFWRRYSRERNNHV